MQLVIVKIRVLMYNTFHMYNNLYNHMENLGYNSLHLEKS